MEKNDNEAIEDAKKEIRKMLKLFNKNKPNPAQLPESECIKKIDPPASIDGYNKTREYGLDFFFKMMNDAPPDYPLNKINGTITLSQRPWALDSKRVELLLDDPDYHYVIGELLPSPIRDMCNEWLNEGKPTYTWVTEVREKAKIIKIRIAFYDKEDETIEMSSKGEQNND